MSILEMKVNDLMHHILGMVFTAGAAAAIGYHMK